MLAFRPATSSSTSYGTIFSLSKSPPSDSITCLMVACSTGMLHVAYVWPSIFLADVMPSALRLMMPDVLC